ncbi:UDP-glycosyltransferase [Morus notabilis]|uniref:UDP-glycosyltransferase n=1 Tax=Morus notabilis TaxID=981085 RepID=W9QQ67_9ROSA|nr:UDP-glycosyltransferase [Morus notabilis]
MASMPLALFPLILSSFGRHKIRPRIPSQTIFAAPVDRPSDTVASRFLDIESDAIKGLQEQILPLYPVGPIVQTGSRDQNYEDSKCLTWLDNKPRVSVLYVSLGSSGTLSHERMTELAFGLDISEQGFIWVVRRPNNAYPDHGPQGLSDPLDFLPRCPTGPHKLGC